MRDTAYYIMWLKLCRHISLCLDKSSVLVVSVCISALIIGKNRINESEFLNLCLRLVVCWY